jgi:hypothetical protein
MAKQSQKLAVRLRQKELKERTAREAEETPPRLYGGMGEMLRRPEDAGARLLPKKRRS